MYSYNRGEKRDTERVQTQPWMRSNRHRGHAGPKHFCRSPTFEDMFLLKGNTEIQEIFSKLLSGLTEDDSLAPQGHFGFLHQNPRHCPPQLTPVGSHRDAAALCLAPTGRGARCDPVQSRQQPSAPARLFHSAAAAPKYIPKSSKSASQNHGKILGRTSVKYKAMKIVHTEVSISDNLSNKFTEKETFLLLLFLHPLIFP